MPRSEYKPQPKRMVTFVMLLTVAQLESIHAMLGQRHIPHLVTVTDPALKAEDLTDHE